MKSLAPVIGCIFLGSLGSLALLFPVFRFFAYWGYFIFMFAVAAEVVGAVTAVTARGRWAWVFALGNIGVLVATAVVVIVPPIGMIINPHWQTDPSDFIYAVPMHDAGYPPGLTRIDPQGGARQTVVTDDVVLLVGGGAAWIVRLGPGDPQTFEGLRWNELIRYDLATGSRESWYCGAETSMTITGLDDGKPVIVVT